MKYPEHRLHPAIADRIARVIVVKKRAQGVDACSKYVYRFLGDDIANDGTHPWHRQIMERVDFWRDKNCADD